MKLMAVAILTGCVAVPMFGQTTAKALPSVTDSIAPSARPAYYDTFNERWLDPAKWATGIDCGALTMECFREIQNGHLRLALRNFGAANSDSGDQWSWTGLTFINPNGVNIITADVTLHSFSGTQCSTNSGAWTHASVEMGGNYFNTGTGDPYDDVSDLVAVTV